MKFWTMHFGAVEVLEFEIHEKRDRVAQVTGVVERKKCGRQADRTPDLSQAHSNDAKRALLPLS